MFWDVEFNFLRFSEHYTRFRELKIKKQNKTKQNPLQPPGILSCHGVKLSMKQAQA